MNNPHLDATKGWLEYSAEQNPDNDGRAMHAAALAQAEATLALAYEQRTANLIAAYTYGIVGPSNESVDESTIITRLGLGETK